MSVEYQEPARHVDDSKVSDLIKLVDHLKKRLKESEDQLKQMQHMMTSKVNVTKDNQEKNVKLATLQGRYDQIEGQFTAQTHSLEQAKHKLAEVSGQLREEREKSSRLEVQLRSMELGMRSAKELEEELRQVRREKEETDTNLRRLTESPFFKEYGDRAGNVGFN